MDKKTQAFPRHVEEGVLLFDVVGKLVSFWIGPEVEEKI